MKLYQITMKSEFLIERKSVNLTHHHANIIPLVAINFNSVVNHQIHELIKATKSPNNHPVCIQLDCNDEYMLKFT